MRRFSGLATLMHLPENMWASIKHGNHKDKVRNRIGGKHQNAYRDWHNNIQRQLYSIFTDSHKQQQRWLSVFNTLCKCSIFNIAYYRGRQ